ncbi:N-acetylmuramoyl-L-alanine amidase [Patescibacteria group bacterium]|nr:MAG: N-acetylmuramoyl-L-alanine amidase [Patescibacteria group bacterium]
MLRKIIIALLVLIALATSALYFLRSTKSGEKITVTNEPSTDHDENLNITPDQSIVISQDPDSSAATSQDTPAETAPDKPKPAQTVLETPDTKPTTVTDQPNIAQHLVSWGHAKASNRTIDTIIIHSSYNALGGDVYNFDRLLEEYQDYGVAPHYLIDRQGKIFRLVADKNIAYHAGEGQVPDGRQGVNNFSLGIEIMTTKDDRPTNEQYATLNKLLTSFKNSYRIKYILGHADIAPGRKTDPWNFEWNKVKK